MAAAGGEDLIGGRAFPLISRGLPGPRVPGSLDGSSAGTHRRVWETSSPPCSTCGHHGSVRNSCCSMWQASSLRAVMPQRTEKCHSATRSVTVHRDLCEGWCFPCQSCCGNRGLNRGLCHVTWWRKACDAELPRWLGARALLRGIGCGAMRSWHGPSGPC